MVSATREINCFTLRSRDGSSRWPRKYLETTTFVACWLQKAGISTSFCWYTVSPPSPVIAAVRSSQSTSSNGWTPGGGGERGKRESAGALRGGAAGAAAAGQFSCAAGVAGWGGVGKSVFGGSHGLLAA